MCQHRRQIFPQVWRAFLRRILWIGPETWGESIVRFKEKVSLELAFEKVPLR